MVTNKSYEICNKALNLIDAQVERNQKMSEQAESLSPFSKIPSNLKPSQSKFYSRTPTMNLLREKEEREGLKIFKQVRRNYSISN